MATLMTVSMATFLTLLALLNDARAGAAGGACDPHTTSTKITINTQDIVFKTDGPMYSTLYGEDIIINCSSNNTGNLRIKVNKPNIGEYKYGCMDSETGCEDSLTVQVAPVISVTSPRVLHNPNVYAFVIHFVPLGEDYEVFCTSNDIEPLSLRSADEELQQTEIINTTSIKHSTRADHKGEKWYSCDSKGPHINGDQGLLYSGTWVTVDYYPEGHNFSCLIHDWHILECTWNYLSVKNLNFKLFYADKVICGNSEMTNTCTWDIKIDKNESFLRNQNITLLLMTCSNKVFCNNQTFVMNSNDLSYSLKYVTVLNTSSHGAVLAWENCANTHAYKVEYVLTAPGEAWQQANTTSMRFNHKLCEFELGLPRAGAWYEVRVSALPAGGIEWSEPKSVFIFTKPTV